MSLIKTPQAIEKMRASAQITKECLLMLASMIKPGVTTKLLDTKAEEFIISRGAVPAFKNHGGFKYTICACVNDGVVHCNPSNYALKDGDIISIDVGAKLNGYYSDAARTFAVGDIDENSRRLIDVTRQCFFDAIKVLRHGSRLSIIGDKIENLATKNGFGVVRDLCGHGIGKGLHEEPRIKNYKNDSAFVVEEGMVLAIEPMINAGSYEVTFGKNNEVKTKDGKRSAHYENTVLITKTGVEILTEDMER